MKNSSFILGLIGGILGILLGGILVMIGLNMKVTDPNSTNVLIFGVLALLSSIAGLVGACIVKNNGKFAGILMIIATIFNIIAAFNAIGGDSPINFIGGFIVAILFLIGGILALKK